VENPKAMQSDVPPITKIQSATAYVMRTLKKDDAYKCVELSYA